MSLEKILPFFMILCLGGGSLIGYFRGGEPLTGMANGAAIGLAVGISPILALAIAYGFILLWCPDRPTCMCGKAKSSDYKHLSHLSKRKSDVYYYRCRQCSREYRLADRRFDMRLSEDDFQPYMVISKLGRWRRDVN